MTALLIPKTDLAAPGTRRRTLAIDCAGLGGHDLGGPQFDICLRADKHGQSIYGPSVAPIEFQRYENQNCIQVVALVRPRQCMNFLCYIIWPPTTFPTTVFRTKYSIKGQHRIYNLYPPLSCDLHTGSGIGASSWFHQSHLLSMLVLLLWHRGCLSDITGALFCCPGTLSGWFPVFPFALCVASNGLSACFCH